MIKAVIFDLDDTLIDEYRFAFSAFKEIATHLAAELQLSEKEVHSQLIELYKKSKTNVFNRFYTLNKKQLSAARLNELIIIYRNHLPEDYQLEDLTEKKLLQLKEQGILLGIITDGFKFTQRNKINAAQLETLFDYIIVTDEIGKDFWKPHDISFKMMQKELNVSFETMIYVGDNLVKDFVAPQKLNMKSIYLNIDNPLRVYNNLERTPSRIIEVTNRNALFDTISDMVNQ